MDPIKTSVQVVVEKEWGFENVICNTPLYCAKFLHISPGKRSSLHRHMHKDETFYVMDGECWIEIGPIGPQTLCKGDSKHIPPGYNHRFSSKDGCTLLEVSTHHSDEDVIRLEPSGSL
jgi:mannose-6-phosphate isomerase-like protein (cupin superfamily)